LYCPCYCDSVSVDCFSDEFLYLPNYVGLRIEGFQRDPGRIITKCVSDANCVGDIGVVRILTVLEGIVMCERQNLTSK
jgi:hypothetical protein